MHPRDRAQQEIAEALASLNLPQMPTFPPPAVTSSSSSAAAPAAQPFSSSIEPTITILVVADLDLLSASALSEYTLEHELSVDLCIACGSFCRDEDLHPYLRGSSKEQQQQHQNQHQPRRGTAAATPTTTNAALGDSDLHTPQQHRVNRSRGSESHDGFGTTDGASIGPSSNGGATDEEDAYLLQDDDDEPAPPPGGWSSTPLFRTREQTAALEGLMTATLSQLENIVCRVVYCPGSSDPLTCLIHHQHLRESTAAPDTPHEPQIPSSPMHHPPPQPRRLTPNSRNLHQQWLPLAPGLGAAALLYLDCSERILRETRDSLTRWQHHNTTAPPSTSGAAAATPFSSPFARGGPPSPPPLPPPPPTAASSSSLLHPDDGSDGEDDDDAQGAEDVAFWVDQLQHLQHKSGRGYGETLERLLHLAPPPPSVPRAPVVPRRVIPVPPQTILVTHYVDCTPWVHSAEPSQQSQYSPTPSPPTTPPPRSSNQRGSSASGGARATAASSDVLRSDRGTPEDDDDLWPANGCPVWALPEREVEKQAEGDDDEQEEEVEVDEEEKSSAASSSASSCSSSSDLHDPLPWPVEEHMRFHASDTARERLCLEIASGSPAMHRPRLLRWEPGPRPDRHDNNSNSNNAHLPHTFTSGTPAPVLLPGSLREWGEFSLVHVSLVPDHDHEEGECDDGKSPPPSPPSRSSSRGGGGTTTTTSRTRPKGGATTTPASAAAAVRTHLSPAPTATTAPPPPPAATSPTTNKAAKRSYSWVVQNVDFYRLSERKA